MRWNKSEADDGVRVILLHGKGADFTAGNDLEDFLKKPWKGQAIPPAVRFIHAVARAQKPMVAAVQGLAVGVGTTILLHCDLVYAAETAKFIMPFINLGIVPEAASTVLLPLAIGRQRAAELFMLGAPLSAAARLRNGIGECSRGSRSFAGNRGRCGPTSWRKNLPELCAPARR